MQLIDEEFFLPLPCGTRLSARVWRPADGGAVPAVLEFIPYRKRDNTLMRDESIHPWMAARGYACLRVDLRGSGDSDGLLDDEYSPQELADACAVIGWIAAQPWCTGAVGMMGKSWGGFNCLQTAALAPPALKAVVSVCATVDRFADDIHFKGGTLLGENFAWGSLMLSYQSRPPDPMLRADWREVWLERLREMPHFAADWASHQTRDAFWKHGSVCEDYSALRAHVLAIGGWHDNYMNAPAHLVENLNKPGGPLAKAIIGPWVHQYPHQAVPGPRIAFLGEMLNWWDRWLKGVENGVETLPNYRFFLMESPAPDACAPNMAGRWLAQERPCAQVQMRALALSADGVLGDGAAPETVIASPQTLGAQAGEFFPMGLSGEMAGDQRDDDARSVCFERACPEGLNLLGRARLELTLSCDKPLAFVVARLCDVAPDGASRRIAHGMMNLCHRSDPPEPMVPGAPVTVAFDLDEMGYRLLPGHKLRLALSNAYWPFVWPSPQAARLQLSQGRLHLPVHDGQAAPWHFDPPEPAAPGRLEVLEEGCETRKVCTDVITGAQVYEVRDTSDLLRNPDHGWQTRSAMVERWQIAPDDPLCASTEITWDQSFARQGWAVATRVVARQTASETHLHLHAELTATEAGTEVFRRSFVADIPRHYI
jgi:putative CocE/NonD family hydrolase